jgi:hypothetical protein
MLFSKMSSLLSQNGFHVLFEWGGGTFGFDNYFPCLIIEIFSLCIPPALANKNASIAESVFDFPLLFSPSAYLVVF